MAQGGRGIARHDDAEGARLLTLPDRIKRLLWHGNQYRAGEGIAFFEDDVDGPKMDHPNLRTMHAPRMGSPSASPPDMD